MVQTTTKITTLAIVALLATTGFAAAQTNPIAILTGDGGGEASGQAEGTYYADATGALDAADEGHADARDQALAHWNNTNNAYDESKANAEQIIDEAEPPEAQNDLGEEQLFDQLDQSSQVNAQHTDHVEKAMDAETDYVNAGADLSAAGHVKAFFQDTFTGLKDAYTGLKDMIKTDAVATNDAKSTAKQALHADDDARAQITDTLEQDQDLPEANPRIDGTFAGQHATKATSSAIANGQAGTPP